MSKIISIVVPCYNEEAALKYTIPQLLKIFDDLVGQGKISSESFVLCVDEKDVNAVIKELHELGEKAYEIGVVTAGGEGVCLK